MKKTVSITLGALVFDIEEDAYDRLRAYLGTLKAHFSGPEYDQEIINDIEGRMGEQLKAKIADRRKEAVTLAEVDEVIRSMGTVEDLTGEKPADTTEARHGKKRLYRNPDDQIVAGVAGGIASYFGIDPIIPRLIFAILLVAGGWGLWIYLVLWLIIPEAQTGAQKLEMRGSQVNLASLTENWKERQGAPRLSMIRFFLRETLYLTGRFLRMAGKILAGIIGLVATAAAFFGIFAATLVAIILLANPNSTYIHPAVAQVFNGVEYILLVVAGYIAATVPLLVILLAGASLVRRRNIFTAGLTASLALVWLAGSLTFGGVALSSSQQVEAAVRSIEAAPEQSREFPVGEFTAVESSQDQRVTVTHGSIRRVVVYGSERQVKNAEVTVTDGRLVLGQSADEFRLCLFCIEHDLRVEIITPELSAVTARNSSAMTVSGFPELEKFSITADNAARVTFRGSIADGELFATNAARVTLQGDADTMRVQLANAARLDAHGFPVQALEIEATNAARAEVNAVQALTARASGASVISYLGSPTERDIQESNSARIEGN